LNDIHALQNRILELAIEDRPLPEILDVLVHTVEAQSPSGMIGSILLVDEDGKHLRHGAGPSLPIPYNQAVDGIPVGTGVGSCGTAVAEGRPVYVTDIANDPLWADFRELALSHGLQACWSTPFRDSSGNILGTFAMYYHEPREPQPADLELVDLVTRSAALIVNRSRAVSELAAKEARLRLAIEAGSIGEWELDLVTDTAVRARRHDQIFGYSDLLPEWGIEKMLSHVVPEDRPAVANAFKEAAKTGTGWNFSCRIKRAGDDQIRWICAHSAPQLDATGKAVKMFGMVQDITPQKEAEDRLRILNETLEIQVAERTASLLLHETIVQSHSSPFCAFDTDYRLIAFNRAHSDEFFRITGHRVQLGEVFPELLPIDQRETMRGLMERALTGESYTVTEEFGDEDLAKPVWEISYYPLRNAKGEIFGAFHHANDISASIKAQLDLELAQDGLRQAQKMEAVGQLTGGLAHDFNNLLTGVMGNLELLQMRIGQGKFDNVDRFVNAAQGAGRRAAALTQRLLAFSRRQTLDPKPTDVNRLVAGMEDLLCRTVGTMIEIEVVGAAGLWPALIDAGQLENALLNLCINGRDAMPDGGRLTIETANKWIDERTAVEREIAPGQYLSLCVTDTGTGMSAATIARAFDPFFTTKPIGEGTGLGLSMIYGFARQSGGQVRIYSEVGQGTTVGIYLPRHHGDADDIMAVPTVTSPGDGHGETVLVVDDEPTIRHLIDEVLNEMGYTVLVAADGPAGMKVLQSGARIDLLITDVGLPKGMNGRQVADAARVLRPALKVLFITGYAENAAVGNGHMEPGMELLTKPFAMDDLRKRVKDIIDQTARGPNADGPRQAPKGQHRS